MSAEKIEADKELMKEFMEQHFQGGHIEDENNKCPICLFIDKAAKYDEAIHVMKIQAKASIELISLQQSGHIFNAETFGDLQNKIHYPCQNYLRSNDIDIWDKDNRLEPFTVVQYGVVAAIGGRNMESNKEKEDKSDELDVEMDVAQDKDGNIVPSINLKNKDIRNEKQMIDGIEFEAEFADDFKKVIFTFGDSVTPDKRKETSEKFMNMLNRISVYSLK